MDKNYSETHSIALINEVRSQTPQIASINQLLADGANINYPLAENGYTPLMYAVTAGNDTLVHHLLESGANSLVKNQQQQIASDLVANDTPIYMSLKNNELLFATAANDVAAVKQILAQGANVNHQGPGKYSALLIAVEKSYLELVELLILHKADTSLTRYDGRDVFLLVTDRLIDITLETGEPLSEEDKREYYAERERPSEAERYEQARLRALEARKGKAFHVEQLQFYDTQPAATEEQIHELEKYFGHPLPAHLNEIYRHYNGGIPQHYRFSNYDSIEYFYVLNNDKENIKNVWNVIENFSPIIGANSLPFAEHCYGSVYYLKWEDNQAKVYLFLYGEFALEHADEDEIKEFNAGIPYFIEKTSDSLDEFLAGLYDPN